MNAPSVNVTIPVFNEAEQLAACVTTVERFLSRQPWSDYEIVIANNGSSDQTGSIADALARDNKHIRAVHLQEKGRGRALKQVWSASEAYALSYMDVDLSTDLAVFPRLIEAVTTCGFDIAVGSRLAQGAVVTRGWKRECISRCYNRIIKLLVHTHFSDAQCGFKAIRRAVARQLLPLVKDCNWFFDTEMLVWAEKLGYTIFDLPVKWTDDADSRVKIFRTAVEDLIGLARVRRTLAQRGLK